MNEPRVTAEQRRQVVERARGLCEYCRSPALFSPDPFSVEHIVPQSSGGANVLDNLALACQGCNGHKHAKTHGQDPVTGEVVALFHPRQQRWAEHFSWADSYARIVGITPTGRATVKELNLNRQGLVNYRCALHAFGVHPPQEPEPT